MDTSIVMRDMVMKSTRTRLISYGSTYALWIQTFWGLTTHRSVSAPRWLKLEAKLQAWATGSLPLIRNRPRTPKISQPWYPSFPLYWLSWLTSKQLCRLKRLRLQFSSLEWHTFLLLKAGSNLWATAWISTWLTSTQKLLASSSSIIPVRVRWRRTTLIFRLFKRESPQSILQKTHTHYRWRTSGARSFWRTTTS